MKLWIFHHYATLPSFNGHIRPYRFAMHLRDHGVISTIFAASYQHFSGENLITGGEASLFKTEGDANFVFINTPSSAHGGASRINNMFAFYRGLLKVCNQYEKPDVILASSPHPLAMLAGIKIAKRFGIPCICEVRDLWPEAIYYATKISPSSIVGKVLTAGEHWIYSHADALVFTKEGDIDYLSEHGWLSNKGGNIDISKCYYINNGVELSEYHQQMSDFVSADPCLEDETFKVIYAGAIRPVNNVANIVETAKFLHNNEDVRFLIYGDGNQRVALEKQVTEEGLENIVFKGFVERKYLPYILSKASVNLLNYSSTKYNWSRGNSSNKLFDYMASGKPIIATMKTGYSIIDKYKCGIELDSDDPRLLADAILKIKNMSKNEYNKMRTNAARGAKDFDYKALSEKLMSVIDETIIKYRQR